MQRSSSNETSRRDAPFNGALAYSREVLISRGKESYDDFYSELYDLSRRLLPARPRGTLQPTALAHETWIRLERAGTRWSEIRDVRALFARTMRSVLVDHARAAATEKRGGGRVRVSFLPEGLLAHDGSADDADLLALDEALRAFANDHHRAARVVELRFFGGLTLAETGALLGVSSSTVDDDWRFARAALFRALST